MIRHCLKELVRDALGKQVEFGYAMLWLFAYTFLLRVPSEVRFIVYMLPHHSVICVRRHCLFVLVSQQMLLWTQYRQLSGWRATMSVLDC